METPADVGVNGFETRLKCPGRGPAAQAATTGTEKNRLYATSRRSNLNDIAVYSPRCAAAQQSVSHNLFEARQRKFPGLRAFR